MAITILGGKEYEMEIFLDRGDSTLRSNPYTYKVTYRTIAFTVEFKEIFYSRLQEGITPSTIVSELGYDPEILGYPHPTKKAY